MHKSKFGCLGLILFTSHIFGHRFSHKQKSSQHDKLRKLDKSQYHNITSDDSSRSKRLIIENFRPFRKPQQTSNKKSYPCLVFPHENLVLMAFDLSRCVLERHNDSGCWKTST